MPTYALQWRAIQIAKARKCLEYDMFGIASNPEPFASHVRIVQVQAGIWW